MDFGNPTLKGFEVVSPTEQEPNAHYEKIIDCAIEYQKRVPVLVIIDDPGASIAIGYPVIFLMLSIRYLQ